MNIGDYVFVKECLDNSFCIGEIARVISLRGENLGLEFEKCIRGHSCVGRGKVGYCWYISKERCIPIKSIAYLLYERGENSS